MKLIKGFDETVLHGDTRDERVKVIKTYLSQWMNPGDFIGWNGSRDEGHPHFAMVYTEYYEPTDACAYVV